MSVSSRSVLLSPDLVCVFRLHQTCVDPQTLSGLPHASVEHVAHAEVAPDLLGLRFLAGIALDGASCDHEQSRQSRKPRSEVLGQPVSEILLLRLTRHVGERKHRDRWFVRRHGCSRSISPRFLEADSNR